MKFSNSLTIFYSFNWAIWNVIWLVCIFYTGSYSFDGRETLFVQISLLVWIISLLIQIFIIKSISSEVDIAIDLFSMVQFLGEGNLIERRGARTNDEIGKMTISVNKILADLTEMIRNIHIVGIEVANSSGKLSESSFRISQNTEEQAASLEETTISMQEMSSKIQTTSKEAVSQSEHMSNVTEQITSLLKSLAVLQENTKLVVISSGISVETTSFAQIASEEMLNILKQIVHSSNDVLSVTDIINSITKKTHLLALNASIEAARVGKSGVGFAVVAEEMTKLATDSQEATVNIQELVISSRNIISTGVEKYNKLADFIVQINKASMKTKEVGTSMEEEFKTQLENILQVSGYVKKVNDLAGQIAISQSMQNQIADAIANAIDDISQRAEQVSALTGNMNSNVTELNDEAKKLKQFISQFSISKS